MGDNILTQGDQVLFTPAFGNAMVVVVPTNLQATSTNVRINGKFVALQGDERTVIEGGCAYNAPPFVGGVGMVRIKALAANQTSQKVKCNRKALLLKGGSFQATFTVNTPALNPSGAPDANPMYSGDGNFIPQNMKVMGS